MHSRPYGALEPTACRESKVRTAHQGRPYGKKIRKVHKCRKRWPLGLRRGSAAAHLLGIACSNPVVGVDVSCECCVL